MEEWQRQQKAEKEAERKKKMESAEMLQGYRGGVKEEDLKLKALRDEERRRHQDAAANLHSYQAKEIKTIPKTPKQRGPQTDYPTPVNVGSDGNASDRLAGIVAGSVSERAAALAAAGLSSAPPETPPAIVSETNQPPVSAALDETTVMTDSPVLVEVPPDVESAAAAAAAAVTDSPVLVPPVTDEAPFQASSSGVEVEPTTMSAADTLEAPLAKNGFATDAAATNTNTRTMTTATAAVPPSEPIRLDILFSFGLVTVLRQPDLTNYMNAVEKIVSTALSPSDDEVQVQVGVTFDPSKKRPFVKGTEWDTSYVSRSGRTDVKRMVVTAAVPVYAKDASLRKAAKARVVGALQAAIQSGSFLSMAQN